MKKILFPVFILSISLLFCPFSFSQISIGGNPYGFINPLKNNVQTVTMPALDMAKIQREDALDEQLGKLPKAGRLHPVSLNLINSGTWTELCNGDRIWRIKLVSKNALAISLYYDNFYIPNGAIMYVYNENKSEVIGGFTNKNNHSSGLFATELLRGDATIVEYYEPVKVKGKGIINISDIAHAYRFINPLNSMEKVSDPCEVDVICSEGDNWRDQIRSVAKLQIKEGSFFFFCSGALVNNVRQDCTPYLLTAAHCAENSSDADLNQTIFYFNYERPTCGSGFAPTNQSMTGATRIANDVNCGVTMGSDFLLLEINDTIPVAYNVFYAGWNANTSPSPSGVSIHHPAADEKKISTYTSALTNSFWCSAPTPSTHWRVFWAATANGHGVTEGGSSGSPIFDNNGRIVGTLTGGGSFCSQVPNPSPDAYGRVSYHWTSNGTAANQRLKNWLDPDNTGTLTLDGTNYPCIPPIADDAGITNIFTPIDTTCSPFPIVTLRNFGSNTLNNVTINYSVDSGAPSSFSWTGSLPSLASEDVTLTTLTLSTGPHTFDVYTSNPNSQVDGNTGNDSSSSSFTFISANPLTLTFVTADHSLAYLVSWSVKNSSGTVVDSSGGYDRNSTNTERICIEDGCYTFTVYDPVTNSINDAIYLLVNASGDTLVSGSEFGGLDTTYSFCVTMPLIDDAGITNIITPIDTTCSSPPIVTLRNFGSNTLNNVTINYSVDGGAPNSFSWTGSLPSLASEDVTLTTLTLSTGPHTFDVYTSNPNSQIDSNTGNDSISSSFIFISANSLTLTFVTANHALAFLVSWDIRDSLGVIVDSSGGYANNTTNTERICIEDGCYAFTVYDTVTNPVNDAIYLLVNASGDILVSGSGFAGPDTTYSFCATPTSIIESAPKETEIELYPNPTKGNLYLNVNLKKSGNLNIKVYNMLGEIVSQMNTFHRSGDNLRMDLTNQANGIYYVEIRTDSDVIVKKVSLVR